jgi:hypothetical protein
MMLWIDGGGSPENILIEKTKWRTKINNNIYKAPKNPSLVIQNDR